MVSRCVLVDLSMSLPVLSVLLVFCLLWPMTTSVVVAMIALWYVVMAEVSIITVLQTNNWSRVLRAHVG